MAQPGKCHRVRGVKHRRKGVPDLQPSQHKLLSQVKTNGTAKTKSYIEKHTTPQERHYRRRITLMDSQKASVVTKNSGLKIKYPQKAATLLLVPKKFMKRDTCTKLDFAAVIIKYTKVQKPWVLREIVEHKLWCGVPHGVQGVLRRGAALFDAVQD